jgi:hypothetical protein
VKPTEAPRAQEEPLTRQHHRRDARRRQDPALHRRLPGDKPHLEAVDLRHGDRAGILRLLFIKIPGTAEELPVITECIAAGVTVNVTR